MIDFRPIFLVNVRAQAQKILFRVAICLLIFLFLWVSQGFSAAKIDTLSRFGDLFYPILGPSST